MAEPNLLRLRFLGAPMGTLAYRPDGPFHALELERDFVATGHELSPLNLPLDSFFRGPRVFRPTIRRSEFCRKKAQTRTRKEPESIVQFRSWSSFSFSSYEAVSFCVRACAFSRQNSVARFFCSGRFSLRFQ